MIDKEEYKALIHKRLVEKGYLKDRSLKEEYRELIHKVLIEKGYLDDENDKSYSHKPHLASLPYDHNTNDLDKLQKRVDAIDERMDALNEERENINEDIDSLQKKIKNFGKDDETLQKEALDSTKSIQDRFHDELKGYDIGKATINGEPNPVYNDIMSLNEVFEFSGLMGGMDADSLRATANKLVDFAYEQTDGDDTPWSNRVIGIADDLRALADKHDVNNNQLGNNLEFYISTRNTLSNLYGAYRENRKLYNDYKSERIRTKEHMKRVEDSKKNN